MEEKYISVKEYCEINKNVTNPPGPLTIQDSSIIPKSSSRGIYLRSLLLLCLLTQEANINPAIKLLILEITNGINSFSLFAKYSNSL